MSDKLRGYIVEDEGMTALLIRRALTSLGYEVVGAASDGKMALGQIQELQPDFVVIDINIPGMNGIELTRRLMTERPIPIFFLTAFSDRASEAIEAGACGYLVKPIVTEQLGGALQMAIHNFQFNPAYQDFKGKFSFDQE